MKWAVDVINMRKWLWIRVKRKRAERGDRCQKESGRKWELGVSGCRVVAKWDE